MLRIGGNQDQIIKEEGTLKNAVLNENVSNK